MIFWYILHTVCHNDGFNKSFISPNNETTLQILSSIQQCPFVYYFDRITGERNDIFVEKQHSLKTQLLVNSKYQKQKQSLQTIHEPKR